MDRNHSNLGPTEWIQRSMDQRSWKDPENFRPERFLDKDNTIINSEKMIAFGLGM